MTPTPYRPLAVLALVGAILAYVGCSRSIDVEPPGLATTAGKEPSPSKSDGGSTKLFADWPTPAAALLISGEQDGYLEPCGCASGQLGGLRRRFDLIERIREQQKWPLALVDLGSLINNPAGARGGPEQMKAKFNTALKALTLMKYDAFALSVADLKLGVDEVFGQFLADLGEQSGPKVVVANVGVTDGFEKTFRKSVKTTVGPIKIGITAVLAPEALKTLNDPGKEVLLPTVVAPEEALPEVLKDLEKDTHSQVLLVQGPPELARKLAGQFPGFDIVVATSEFDPAENAESLNDGKTLLVSVGKKGKYVGVVGLFQDPKQKYRYQRVTLSSRYNGEASPMRKLIEDDFQADLKLRGVVEDFPRRDYVNGISGSTFAGAETCKTCHPGTYAKWAGTKHAHAFENIVNDPKGERSDHQFDAECVSCHTTGFEYNSGWVSAEKTPFLKGNQCENCHGPASKHAADPDNLAARKAIARNAADADKNGLCLRCHDEDNSPKFNFAMYYGQIAHKGLDRYEDPKVHQGIAPRVARQDSK